MSAMQVSELSQERRVQFYASRIMKHAEDCDTTRGCLCGRYAWVYDGKGPVNREGKGICMLLVRRKLEGNRKTWSVEMRISYERLVSMLQDYY